MPENMYNCLYDRRRLIFFLVNGFQSWVFTSCSQNVLHQIEEEEYEKCINSDRLIKLKKHGTELSRSKFQHLPRTQN